MAFTPAERGRCRIVGTPIGNLSDLTPRAIDAITEADILFAEDTRTMRELLHHLCLSKAVRSYHKDNERSACTDALRELSEGKRIALVSEAGMPGISDPGFILVEELIKRNIAFEVVPGVSACVHAAVASGLVKEGRYLFAGFLPHNDAEKTLLRLKSIPFPIVFYESVHRLKTTLALLLAHFPPPVAVGRELTKLYEEFIYVHTKEDMDKITSKGEFTLVVDNGAAADENSDILSVSPYRLAELLFISGMSKKAAVEFLKKLGLKRNRAYGIAEQIWK